MSTFEKMKAIIVHCTGVDPELVSISASLTDDLGLDSLDIVQIIIAAEDDFGVLIEDETMEKVITVRDAVDAVDHALSHSGAAA